jgi:hypothetical protein
VNPVELIAGAYTGQGIWYDEDGKSGTYTAVETIVANASGFDVTFKHDFDDGSVVNAHFTMVWIGPSLFRVESAGNSIGNGYVFDRLCHYHLRAGDAFVEVSYRNNGDGLEVFGSSTRNAEGKYIAWKQALCLARSSPAGTSV